MRKKRSLSGVAFHTNLRAFKKRVSLIGPLLAAVSVLPVASIAIADTVIDPFSEGHTAVTDYEGFTDTPPFFVLAAGAQWQNDLTPGYGDVVFNKGEQAEFFTLQTSYIGLDSPQSRGRVFVEDQGTVIHANGGLSVNGNGSVLSVTDGAEVRSRYGIEISDAVAGEGVAQLVVNGPGSLVSDGPGDTFDSGRLIVDSGAGEAKVAITNGGRVQLYGSKLDGFPTTLTLADINADFEVSGAGSTLETAHQLHLRTGEGQSARILDGGRIVQTEDIGDTLENPVAFSFSGGTSEDTGLLVSGADSRLDLVNDTHIRDSGYATLRDGASLTTQGSVLVDGKAPGATQVVVDNAVVEASRTVIGEGAAVSAKNGSIIRGDVELNGGELAVAREGLTVAGDLSVGSGILALDLDIGASPALTVEGTALFGPNSFIRLLLSAVPSGDILVDDYLIADMIEFEPQFSLAAQLEVKPASGVDWSEAGEFSVRFASLDQSVTFNSRNVVQAPEIDGSKFPLAVGLLTLILALRRERRR